MPQIVPSNTVNSNRAANPNATQFQVNELPRFAEASGETTQRLNFQIPQIG
jgi:hypothetical protein